MNKTYLKLGTYLIYLAVAISSRAACGQGWDSVVVPRKLKSIKIEWTSKFECYILATKRHKPFGSFFF